MSPYPRAEVSLRGVRLGVPRPYFCDRLQPDVRTAFETAIAVLADLGAAIVDVEWREARLSAATGFVICRPELAAVHEQSLRAAPDRYGPVLRARLEAFSLLPGRDYLRARRAQAVVKRTITDLYREHHLTALLTPTTPATATLADALTIAYPDGEDPVHAGFTRCTMPFNPTGQPVLSLPCGVDRDGLPIGLQIVGRPDDEPAICAIGRAFEAATDHHRIRPPSPI
jgi:aspartyl-tRNA(Asn)/glutamyl-tRNA(Gln) amidotransferase subunit A